MMSIRVLLVDDHLIMREGLKLLLLNSSSIDVVAEASNGQEAVRLATESLPDVVVMDLTMPVMGGIEAARQIVAAHPDMKILVLSMVADESCIEESLKAGVKGYLLKDCAAEELVIAIHAVAEGQSYLSSKITDIVIRGYTSRTSGSSPDPLALLSRRELEVLRLIAEGKNTKEIAFGFSVSVKTVETQRKSIMKKLELYSIAELTRFAISKGLVTIEQT
jgi:DNA-binding NarL/FixJ family response regulator